MFFQYFCMDNRNTRKMRILIFTPDLSPADMKRPYNTGFSLMVNQIAESLGEEGYEVFVSCSAFFSERRKSGHYTLMERNARLMASHIRMKDIAKAVKYAFLSPKKTLHERRTLLKYSLSTGFCQYIIKETNPDAVFIHSAMPAVIPFISASIRCNRPFVITLHGVFHRFSPCFQTYMEKSVMKVLIKKGITVTAISSGTRRRLLEECGCGERHNVKTVLNASPAPQNIPAEKVKGQIVAVGNICERKNQAQLLRAFALLPERLKEKSTLVLIGKDTLGGSLQQLAASLGISGKCSFTGSLSHRLTYEYMTHSDILVLPSKDEGFGLPITEGYKSGLPAVCFNDIDAFADLYNPLCMIGVTQRSDKALAEAITQALQKDWDRDAIRAFGEKFSTKEMARQYAQALAGEKGGKISEQEFDKAVNSYIMRTDYLS